MQTPRYLNNNRMTTINRLRALVLIVAAAVTHGLHAQERVITANGTIEGIRDESNGIRSFKGIPFAAPPIGDLRWQAPQPVKNWESVRQANKFAPRAMQRALFGDMGFRADGMGEDCLYLNVWTPAKSGKDRLPVLVYYYGGGFQAGDGSEARYDGESMARKGIVAITVNYRLDVFGFFAHPELTRESPNHASGNYGLLDQAAALQWVRRNIAAFGGDPKKITIAGESAGSLSVNALMASPLSRDLIAGAIGESGSVMGTLTPVPLSEAEAIGVKFATNNGAATLAALRAMPAKQLLDAAGKRGVPRFPLVVDGYFLPKDVTAIFSAGEQSHVPLLVGWNSEEMTYRLVLNQEPTLANFENALKRLYPERWEEALKVYRPADSNEVVQAATDLAGDRFIAYSTWKWADLHSQTGRKPVYRYYFARARPAMKPEMGDATPGLAGGVVRSSGNSRPQPPARGAVHSAEIEYAMGNLPGNPVYAWTPDDFKVSNRMQAYFANFIKTGNPNGKGLTKWPALKKGSGASFMRLDTDSHPEIEQHRDRYLFLDSVATKRLSP